MPTPDPEGMSLLAKIASGAGSVIGAAWGGMVYLNGRFDKKADKDDVKRALSHIEKLYENAEQDRKTLHECVDKLGDQMHENHVELIREIAKKADR